MAAARATVLRRSRRQVSGSADKNGKRRSAKVAQPRGLQHLFQDDLDLHTATSGGTAGHLDGASIVEVAKTDETRLGVAVKTAGSGEFAQGRNAHGADAELQQSRLQSQKVRSRIVRSLLKILWKKRQLRDMYLHLLKFLFIFVFYLAILSLQYDAHDIDLVCPCRLPLFYAPTVQMFLTGISWIT
ncbi:hypothetical protein CYMTET_25164 [Cymbomonas tetramitiformis]|uniref:Uncharacterized protein n=1 Tax=Cymbomonas tetramitiformis TaxID=36881 RepID=A0AAE0KZB2_9CHLO|nr:hypothetical protein CYMTET_25164 [Cymbomonas tetramitiformis]